MLYQRELDRFRGAQEREAQRPVQPAAMTRNGFALPELPYPKRPAPPAPGRKRRRS